MLGGKKVTLRPVIQRLPAIVGSLSAYTVEREGGCNGPASRCSRLINPLLTMPSLWLGCVTEQLIKRPRAKAPRPRTEGPLFLSWRPDCCPSRRGRLKSTARRKEKAPACRFARG